MTVSRASGPKRLLCVLLKPSTWDVVPYPRAPSIQIIPTLGSKVWEKYLLWAIGSLRVILTVLDRDCGTPPIRIPIKELLV